MYGVLHSTRQSIWISPVKWMEITAGVHSNSIQAGKYRCGSTFRGVTQQCHYNRDRQHYSLPSPSVNQRCQVAPRTFLMWNSQKCPTVGCCQAFCWKLKSLSKKKPNRMCIKIMQSVTKDVTNHRIGIVSKPSSMCQSVPWLLINVRKHFREKPDSRWNWKWYMLREMYIHFHKWLFRDFW